MLFIICRGPESNRYDRYQSQDFKSCASASSATPASSSERRDSNPRPPPWQGGVLPLNYVRIDFLFYIKKCRLHDLNTRPSDYKSDALPTELSRLIIILLCGLRDLNPHAVKRQILNLVRLPIPPNPQNMTRTGLEPVTH